MRDYWISQVRPRPFLVIGGADSAYAATMVGGAVWPGCSALGCGQPPVLGSAGRPSRKPWAQHAIVLGLWRSVRRAHDATPQIPLALTFSAG